MDTLSLHRVSYVGRRYLVAARSEAEAVGLVAIETECREFEPEDVLDAPICMVETATGEITFSEHFLSLTEPTIIFHPGSYPDD